jgi:hypothetical protein
MLAEPRPLQGRVNLLEQGCSGVCPVHAGVVLLQHQAAIMVPWLDQPNTWHLAHAPTACLLVECSTSVTCHRLDMCECVLN